MSREVEWPPGSGMVATYSSVELRFVHDLTKARENEAISGKEFKAQIDFLHEAKVLFDARMLSREEEVERGYRLPVEGHGEFKIPEAAQLAFQAEQPVEDEDRVVWDTATGWPCATPTPAMLRRADARLHDGDKRKPNTLRNVGSAEQRRAGFIAEELFAAWLGGRKVPHVKHGGPDELPDFEIAGLHVGLKFCGAKIAYRPTHVVYVFERHLGRAEEYVFFGNDATRIGGQLLLGGVSNERLLAEGEVARAGVELVRGFVAEEDLRWVRVRQLDAPEEWIVRIT